MDAVFITLEFSYLEQLLINHCESQRYLKMINLISFLTETHLTFLTSPVYSQVCTCSVLSETQTSETVEWQWFNQETFMTHPRLRELWLIEQSWCCLKTNLTSSVKPDKMNLTCKCFLETPVKANKWIFDSCPPRCLAVLFSNQTETAPSF